MGGWPVCLRQLWLTQLGLTLLTINTCPGKKCESCQGKECESRQGENRQGRCRCCFCQCSVQFSSGCCEAIRGRHDVNNRPKHGTCLYACSLHMCLEDVHGMLRHGRDLWAPQRQQPPQCMYAHVLLRRTCDLQICMACMA